MLERRQIQLGLLAVCVAALAGGGIMLDPEDQQYIAYILLAISAGCLFLLVLDILGFSGIWKWISRTLHWLIAPFWTPPTKVPPAQEEETPAFPVKFGQTDKLGSLLEDGSRILHMVVSNDADLRRWHIKEHNWTNEVCSEIEANFGKHEEIDFRITNNPEPRAMPGSYNEIHNGKMIKLSTRIENLRQFIRRKSELKRSA